MATNISLGEQMRRLMNSIQYYDRNTVDKSIQNISFMTLIWPLLPILPPEPPTPLAELLREQEACDMCGKTGTSVLPSSTSSTTRARPTTERTPLDQLMLDIEKKMNETLKSIESTTKRNDDLYKKLNTVEQIGKSDLTDAEVLKKLKSLINEKAIREARVKVLEDKEQELKMSLMAAIDWAKSGDAKETSFSNQQNSKTVENQFSEEYKNLPLNNQ